MAAVALRRWRGAKIHSRLSTSFFDFPPGILAHAWFAGEVICVLCPRTHSRRSCWSRRHRNAAVSPWIMKAAANASWSSTCAAWPTIGIRTRCAATSPRSTSAAEWTTTWWRATIGPTLASPTKPTRWPARRNAEIIFEISLRVPPSTGGVGHLSVNPFRGALSRLVFLEHSFDVNRVPSSRGMIYNRN